MATAFSLELEVFFFCILGPDCWGNEYVIKMACGYACDSFVWAASEPLKPLIMWYMVLWTAIMQTQILKESNLECRASFPCSSWPNIYTEGAFFLVIRGDNYIHKYTKYIGLYFRVLGIVCWYQSSLSCLLQCGVKEWKVLQCDGK